MTMTEKKHAIKPYPLGAHVEDGAIRFAYASGKKDCGILIYDRKSGKKTHRVPFRQEERMGNVYCKYLELEPENVGYQFYEGERTVPDLHAQGFLRKPAYGKIRKPADRIAVFPNEDFDWEQDMHPMLPYEDSTCYCLHVRGFTMHASSQVTHRGTFAGVVEKLDYLQEIGVTTVEFQPVYEFDETPEKTVPKTSGELVAVAGEKNVLLELNNTSLSPTGPRQGAYDNDVTMLKLCKEAGVCISIGSDAHIKESICDFDRAYKVIEEVGFPKELIVNSNTELYESYIGKRQ